MHSDPIEPEQERWMSFRHFLADCRCARCGIEPQCKTKPVWDIPNSNDADKWNDAELDVLVGIAITQQLKSLGWRRINEYYGTLLCPICAAKE